MTKVTITQGKILQFRNEAKTMLVKYILTLNKLKTEREHIHEVEKQLQAESIVLFSYLLNLPWSAKLRTSRKVIT